MMDAAPGSSVRVPVVEAIEAVIVHHQLDDPVIRLSELGPRLYVEVDVNVSADVTIEQPHRVRLDLERRPQTP